jgi:MoaA/NifB/PqqE/SkfB family radical SAM enzyme
MAKLAETKPNKPGMDILFTPRGDKPTCDENCKHCYYFANYKEGDSAVSASSMPDLVSQSKQSGYGSVFTITSELLLAPNWKDILKAAGDNYVNTNGNIIVHKEGILDELAEAGVNQIVITANITESHEQLSLTNKNTVDKAFQLINAYNGAHEQPVFSTVATVIVTSENYDKIAQMCDHVVKVYGANVVKFEALVPLDEELKPLSPSHSQLRVSIDQIKSMRRKYKPEELYVQRDGTMGSQGLTEEKLANLCPAGDGIHTVNGSKVTPCIFIPAHQIGHVENGNIIIDQEKLDAFLELKHAALAEGYCPAHAIANGNV